MSSFTTKIIMSLVVVLLFLSPVYGETKARRKSRMTPQLAQQIVTIARRYEGLDPLLILEVMRMESSFNQFAQSPAGAQGLMQFIPATAARFGMVNPFDPEEAIDAGCRYLVYLLNLFNGRLDLALAGYNAGENAVIKHGYRVPPYAETQNYVKTIIAAYLRARAVAAGDYRSINNRRTPTSIELQRKLAEIDSVMFSTVKEHYAR